jgi:hypothetical protein
MHVTAKLIIFPKLSLQGNYHLSLPFLCTISHLEDRLGQRDKETRGLANERSFTLCVYRLRGVVVRISGCRTEMCCVSCEVQTEFVYVIQKKVDRLCSLVVRVSGCRREMYCVSCEVQTDFI